MLYDKLIINHHIINIFPNKYISTQTISYSLNKIHDQYIQLTLFYTHCMNIRIYGYLTILSYILFIIFIFLPCLIPNIFIKCISDISNSFIKDQ